MGTKGFKVGDQVVTTLYGDVASGVIVDIQEYMSTYPIRVRLDGTESVIPFAVEEVGLAPQKTYLVRAGTGIHPTHTDSGLPIDQVIQLVTNLLGHGEATWVDIRTEVNDA